MRQKARKQVSTRGNKQRACFWQRRTVLSCSLKQALVVAAFAKPTGLSNLQVWLDSYVRPSLAKAACDLGCLVMLFKTCLAQDLSNGCYTQGRAFSSIDLAPNLQPLDALAFCLCLCRMPLAPTHRYAPLARRQILVPLSG